MKKYKIVLGIIGIVLIIVGTILKLTVDEKSDLYGVAALIRGIGFILLLVLGAKLLKKS